MKNKIIMISIIIVVIIVIIYLVYILLNKKPTKLSVSRLEFRYNTGNAMSANVHYKIECKDKCTAVVKLNMQEELEFDVDECYLKKVEEIVNKYNLSSWDNFKKSNKHVLDGKDFDLYITTKEGKHIEASGYEMWPKNYKEVKAELDDIFNQMNDNPTNNTEDVDLKPIIYLYPEKEMDISIKLGYKDKLTIS